MKSLDIYRVSFVLAALLGIAALLMLQVPGPSRINPDSASYDPGGAAALAALLKQSGFRTSQVNGPTSDLQAGDLVIAFVPHLKDNEYDPEDAAESVKKYALDSNANLLELPFITDAVISSQEWQPASVKNVITGKKYVIKAISGIVNDTNAFEGGYPLILLDQSEDDSYDEAVVFGSASSSSSSHPQLVVSLPGSLAINSGLGQSQNAELIVDTVRMLSKTGRVVINNATFTNEQPTFLEALGPWAQLGWEQILFVFAVIVFTLGIRFGLPEYKPRAQLGARQYADAYAEILRRSQGVDGAMQRLVENADSKIRREFRISRTADKGKRNSLIPPPLADALQKAERSTGADIKPAEAASAAAALEAEMKTSLPSRSGRTR